jgi:hypothetical protein
VSFAPPHIVPYLGARDYVHGTTLFALMAPHMSDAADVTFKVSRRVISNRLHLETLDASTDVASSYPCSAIWQRAGRFEGLGLLEDGPPDPMHRVAWDEAKLTRVAVVDGNTLRAAGLSAHPLIECLVAMNKHLLRAHLGAVPGLLFTRLDLARVPASVDALVLTVKDSAARQHFMSSIEGDGEKLGRIIFSLAAQP